METLCALTGQTNTLMSEHGYKLDCELCGGHHRSVDCPERINDSVPAASGYEALLQTITNAPTTWLGGILAHTIKECLRRKFFRNAEWLTHFVRRVIEEPLEK